MVYRATASPITHDTVWYDANTVVRHTFFEERKPILPIYIMWSDPSHSFRRLPLQHDPWLCIRIKATYTLSSCCAASESQQYLTLSMLKPSTCCQHSVTQSCFAAQLAKMGSGKTAGCGRPQLLRRGRIHSQLGEISPTPLSQGCPAKEAFRTNTRWIATAAVTQAGRHTEQHIPPPKQPHMTTPTDEMASQVQMCKVFCPAKCT